MLLHLLIHKFSKNSQEIFADFEWQINTGENWAITGNIGVGKTMLLKIIDGSEYLSLSDGKLILDGCVTKNKIEYVSFSDDKKWIKRADFYYQQRYYTSFTDDEIKLYDFLQLDKFDTVQKNKVFVLLEKYHLTSLLNVPFIQLSNGQKNKSILIKALQSSCSLLLLDNPFIGIDTESRKDIFSLIDELTDQKKQVIYTCNYPFFAISTTHILDLKHKEYQTYKKEDFLKAISIAEKEKTDYEYYFSDEKMIELKNVNITYHQKIILDNINWLVLKGEKWAVLGENGSGKSTLLSLLYADHPQAYKNDILLFDEPRRNQSIWEIKSRIGYLSSEFHLHFTESLNVTETIGTGFFDTLSLLRKLSETQINTIHEALSSLNILHLKDRYFLSLSFGEQRLVLFARAVIKKPELLILDEPYQGLDANTVMRCNEFLEIFLDNETTVIFTSHYIEELPKSINKFLHLSNGKIV